MQRRGRSTSVSPLGTNDGTLPMNSTSSKESRHSRSTIGTGSSGKVKGSVGRDKKNTDEHNESCEVCDSGGDLLCCDTCSLVFHLDCVQPMMEAVPAGEWSCAYCISDGIADGDVAQARLAVRNMKKKQTEVVGHHPKGTVMLSETSRLSSATETDISAPSTDDGSLRKSGRKRKHRSIYEGEIEAHVSSVGTPVIKVPKSQIISVKEPKNKISATCSEGTAAVISLSSKPANNQKINKNLKVIDRDYEDGMESNDAGQKLDEMNDELQSQDIILGDEDHGIAHRNSGTKLGGTLELNDDVACGNECAMENNETELLNRDANVVDELWCNVCLDNPEITSCEFCGCKVCSGKLDTPNLIMCDDCDRSIHTYCLNPPLSAVPDEDPWFCPECRSLHANYEQLHSFKKGKDNSDFTMTIPGISGTMRGMNTILVHDMMVTSRGITPRGRGRPPGTGRKSQPFIMSANSFSKSLIDNKNVGKPSGMLSSLKSRKPSHLLQQKMHQQQQLEEANAVAAAAAAKILSKRAAGIDNAIIIINKLGTCEKYQGSLCKSTSSQEKRTKVSSDVMYRWTRDDLLLLDQLRTWGTLDDLEAALIALRTKQEQLMEVESDIKISNSYSERPTPISELADPPPDTSSDAVIES